MERTGAAARGFGFARKPAPLVEPELDRLDLFRNYEEMALGWFWATDAEGCLIYFSPAAARALGQDPDALIGRDLLSLFDEGSHAGARGQRRSLPLQLARQARFEAVKVRVSLPGGVHWWSLSGQPQRDAQGEFAGFLGHGVDVTEEERSAEENERLAQFDTLTGLANRTRMTDRLNATLTAFGPNRACALVVVNLDRFKQINESMGFPVGDALLKQAGERLAKLASDPERVARSGGDEFHILLPDVDDRVALALFSEGIIESLSHPYMINGSRCMVGASVGIAVSPYDGNTGDALIRNTDLALNAAKVAGRGRYRFFSTELLQAAEDRRQLEHDLIDALGNGELAVHYQPIVKAESGEVAGFEALLRWNHPKRGRISPAVFIPIAEDANLIPQLGEWTMRQACIDAAQWPGKLRVAVNVSPIQFASDSLPQIVLSALANSGLKPEQLELEITESVFLGDTYETDERFAALKRLGVRLALDDFGTGYSSLGYLKTAPFDKIKIDQSFVRGTTKEGARNQAIVAAIVALATAMGMETTAEGIESFDQLDTMRALKVSHIQGFLYSRPVPAHELTQHVRDGEWVIKPQGPAKQRHIRHATFRKVGVIHENHYYAAVLRNFSASGALIEGIVDVPEGTQLVIDLGEGQMAVATVRRALGNQQGIEFEQALVEDANGALSTRHRVSPITLAEAGLTPASMKKGTHLVAKGSEGQISLPAFHTVKEWKGI